MRFEGRVGFEADIYMVGCAIFEIRAGFPILEERASYFGRDGQPKNEKEEQLARVLVKAYKTSIRAKIGDTALDAKLFFFSTNFV